MPYRTFMTLGVSLAICATGAAHAASLQAPYLQVHNAYPDAKSVRVDGQPALELRGAEYGGLIWDRVDYVFNAAGRLDHLSMSTLSADYSSVRRLAELQLASPPSQQGRLVASEPASDDMQVRVCESDDGEITMTFEPISTIS